MGSVTPRAAPKPWVNAVLPAPSSPASRITSPGRASSASAAASGARCRSPIAYRASQGHAPAPRGQGQLGPHEVGPHLGHRLAAAAQRVGRVQRRDQHRVAERVLLAPQLGDADLRVEQELAGELAQRDHHLGRDQLDLALEVGPAGVDLGGQRVAVVGRPALDHVGDVDPVAGDAELLEHQPVEQLAGAPDERQTLAVLLGPRTLAHEQQVGVRDRPCRTRPGCARPPARTGCRCSPRRRARRRVSRHAPRSLRAAGPIAQRPTPRGSARSTARSPPSGPAHEVDRRLDLDRWPRPPGRRRRPRCGAGTRPGPGRRGRPGPPAGSPPCRVGRW